MKKLLFIFSFIFVFASVSFAEYIPVQVHKPIHKKCVKAVKYCPPTCKVVRWSYTVECPAPTAAYAPVYYTPGPRMPIFAPAPPPAPVCLMLLHRLCTCPFRMVENILF